ncbi:L-2-amino-thiazoline-4-carboxylic acid hydrolase [Treponema parvum]|uniref:L-2-amino-thiazoline-4-carboxylic acid hydrolase n=1 Tax=Treponema parvum TaxID=138851 RepID=A0A975IE05_9SPIR|nr:L-2-amino-thiazoline-4-carboxylic acid hydrolase [Treponema parvum]QTQ13362.1 L-2-amino-thiazoline-4-carboxylic acid hydrolase [Treponema parvum]
MPLNARNHAFIYGVIAEETLKNDARNEEALIKGIITYGNQRGARMAQLAVMNGKELSMKNYLAFGEWAPAAGEMDVRIAESSPDAVWNVYKCPWNAEWKEKNMLKMGELYCKYVDAALVKGFNNDLELGLDTNQSKGDEFCYFKWNGADMTEENKKDNVDIQKKLGDTRIRLWEYHCGHIYKTLKETLTNEIGTEKTDDIFEKADMRIEGELGKTVVDLMHSGMLLDYWVCPTGKDVNLLKKFFDK